MYILPSLFTAGNIAIGYYIIVQSIRGATMGDNWAFDRAAIAIAVAILFDGLDGRIARMTNTSSAFGRELDSLADVITFGVAPSLLAYLWGVRHGAGVGLSDHSCAVDPLRRGDLFSVSHLRRVPVSAVQHQRESAAAQSRPAGPQILCRHADSRGRGRDRRGHPL
jgi:CDP-diacylglycerol--serine O-phosphatidyltransferase